MATVFFGSVAAAPEWLAVGRPPLLPPVFVEPRPTDRRLTIRGPRGVTEGLPFVRTALLRLYSLARFKFPVGLVFLVQSYRRLRRKSILQDAARLLPKSRRSRSLDLDVGDRECELAGGIDATRVALCRRLVANRIAAAEGAAKAATTDSSEWPKVRYWKAVLEGLELSCPPRERGGREEYVGRMARQLTQLQVMPSCTLARLSPAPNAPARSPVQHRG